MINEWWDDLNVDTIINVTETNLKLHLTDKMKCEFVSNKLINICNTLEFEIRIIKRQIGDLQTYKRIALSKSAYNPKSYSNMKSCIHEDMIVLLKEQHILMEKLKHILELQIIVNFTYDELQNTVSNILLSDTPDNTSIIAKRKANTIINVIIKKPKIG